MNKIDKNQIPLSLFQILIATGKVGENVNSFSPTNALFIKHIKC